MKKITFIIVALLCFHYSFAQIKYESGYFIDNDGIRHECLIKNNDWDNTPTEFYYKLSAESTSQLGKTSNTREFGVANVSKYTRFTVDIDRSSEALDLISNDREPLFNKEEIFLKAVVQGKATLYVYGGKNLRRYFYSLDSSQPVQLIFKSYYSATDVISENNTFRQQLYYDLKCKNITKNNLESLQYEYDALVKIFTKYNNCQNSEIINYDKANKRDLFNLSVRPGIISSSFTAENILSTSQSADFQNQANIRMGLEAEYILPFNKNKWAVFFEPTYQYYKSNYVDKIKKISIDYKSIEIPLGVRHYFFLNDNSKIFINGAIVFDFPKNSTMNFGSVYGDGQEIEIHSKPNAAFGAGYKFQNKFSCEFRYATNRELLNGYIYYVSKYKVVSLVLGYTIF